MNFNHISKSSVINVNGINRAANVIPRITNSLVINVPTKSHELYLPGIKFGVKSSENSFSPNDLLALARHQNGFDFYNSFCRKTKSGSSLNRRKASSTYKTAGKHRKFLCQCRNHNSKENLIELLRKRFIQGKILYPTTGAYFCEKNGDPGKYGPKSKTSNDNACQIKKDRLRQQNIDIYNIKTNIDGLCKLKIKKDDPCKPKEELQKPRVEPISHLPKLPDPPKYTDRNPSLTDNTPFEISGPCTSTPIATSNKLSKSCDPCTQDCSSEDPKNHESKKESTGTLQQDSDGTAAIGKANSIIKKTPNVRLGKLSYHTHKTRKYSSITKGGPSSTAKKPKLASKGQVSSSPPSQNDDCGSTNVGGDSKSSGHAAWKDIKCKKVDLPCPPKKKKPLTCPPKSNVCHDISKALEAINEMQNDPCKEKLNNQKTPCKMVDGKIVCQLKNMCCVLERYDPCNPKHKNISEPKAGDMQFCCKIEDVFCVCTRIEKKSGEYVASSSDCSTKYKCPIETPTVSKLPIQPSPAQMSPYQDFKMRMGGICETIHSKLKKKAPVAVSNNAVSNKTNKLSDALKKNKVLGTKQLEPKTICITPSPSKDLTVGPLASETLCNIVDDKIGSKIPETIKDVCIPQDPCKEMTQSLKCSTTESIPKTNISQEICQEDSRNKPRMPEKKSPCKICGNKLVCEFEDKTCVCEIYNPCKPEHRDPPNRKMGDKKSICRIGNLHCECNKTADIFGCIKETCKSTEDACEPPIPLNTVSCNGNNDKAQLKKCKIIEGKLVLKLKNTCCVCEKFDPCNPEHTDIPKSTPTDKIASCVIENMYCNCVKKSDIKIQKGKRDVNADCFEKDEEDSFFQAIFDKIKFEREARACLTNRIKDAPTNHPLNCKDQTGRKGSTDLLAEICKINKANSSKSKVKPPISNPKDKIAKLNSKACAKVNWAIPVVKKTNQDCEKLSNAICESIEIASEQQNESKDECEILESIPVEEIKSPKVEQCTSKPLNLYNDIAKSVESSVETDPCSEFKQGSLQQSSNEKFTTDCIKPLEKDCEENTKTVHQEPRKQDKPCTSTGRQNKPCIETQTIDPCKLNDPCSPKELKKSNINKTKINDPCAPIKTKGLAESCVLKVNSSVQKKNTSRSSEKSTSSINLHLKINKSKIDHVSSGEDRKQPINIYVNVDLVKKTVELAPTLKLRKLPPSNLNTSSKSSDPCISRERCKPSFECKEACKPSEEQCEPSFVCEERRKSSFTAKEVKKDPSTAKHNAKPNLSQTKGSSCIPNMEPCIKLDPPKSKLDEPCVKVDPCKLKNISSKTELPKTNPCIVTFESKPTKSDLCKPKIDPCLKIDPCKPTIECEEKSSLQKTIDLCKGNAICSASSTVDACKPKNELNATKNDEPCVKVDPCKLKEISSKMELPKTNPCIVTFESKPTKSDLCKPKIDPCLKIDPCKPTIECEEKSSLQKTIDLCKGNATCSASSTVDACKPKNELNATKNDEPCVKVDPCKLKEISSKMELPKTNPCIVTFESKPTKSDLCKPKIDPCLKIDPCKPTLECEENSSLQKTVDPCKSNATCSASCTVDVCKPKSEPSASKNDESCVKVDPCNLKNNSSKSEPSTSNPCIVTFESKSTKRDPGKPKIDPCLKIDPCKPTLKKNASNYKKQDLSQTDELCKPMEDSQVKPKLKTTKEPCMSKPIDCSPSDTSATKDYTDPEIIIPIITNPCKQEPRVAIADHIKAKATSNKYKNSTNLCVPIKTDLCKPKSKNSKPDPCKFSTYSGENGSDSCGKKTPTKDPKPKLTSDPCAANADPCKPKTDKCAPKESLCKPKLTSDPSAAKADPCKPKTDKSAPKESLCKPKLTSDPSAAKADPCKPKTDKSAPKESLCKPKLTSDPSAAKADPCKPKTDKSAPKESLCKPKLTSDPSAAKADPCKPKTDKSAPKESLCKPKLTSDPSAAKADPCKPKTDKSAPKESLCKPKLTSEPSAAKADPCKPKTDKSAPKENICKPKLTSDPCAAKADPCKPKTDKSAPKESLCKPKLTSDPSAAKADPCKPKTDKSAPKENICKPKLTSDPSAAKADPCKPKTDKSAPKENLCKAKLTSDPSAAKADPCKPKTDKSAPKESLCKPKLTSDPSAAKADPCKPKTDKSAPKENLCKPKLTSDPSAAKADPCKLKTDKSAPKENLCKPKLTSDPSAAKADPCKPKTDKSAPKENLCKPKLTSDPSAAKADPCKPKTDICAPKENLCKPKLTSDPSAAKADPCKPKTDKSAPKENLCKPKLTSDPCAAKANPCKPKTDKSAQKENLCKPKLTSDPCAAKADPCKPKTDICAPKENICKPKLTLVPCAANADPYKPKTDICAPKENLCKVKLAGLNVNPCNNKEAQLDICKPKQEPIKLNECIPVKPKNNLEIPRKEIKREVTPDQCADKPRVVISDMCRENSDASKSQHVTSPALTSMCIPLPESYKKKIEECKPSPEVRTPKTKTSTEQECTEQVANEQSEETKRTRFPCEAKVNPCPDPWKDKSATTIKNTKQICDDSKDESGADICKYSPCNPETPFNLQKELKTSPSRYTDGPCIDPCTEKEQFCVKCEDLIKESECGNKKVDLSCEAKKPVTSKSTLCTIAADTLQYPCPPLRPPKALTNSKGNSIFSSFFKPQDDNQYQEIKDPKLHNEEMIEPRPNACAPVMENNPGVKIEELQGSRTAVQDPREQIAKIAISKGDKLKNSLIPPHDDHLCKQKDPCEEEKMKKVEMSAEMCRKLKGDADKKVCLFETGAGGKDSRTAEDNMGKGTCYEDSCKDVSSLHNQSDCRPAPQHGQPPFKPADCPAKHLKKEPRSKSDIITFPAIPPLKVSVCIEPPTKEVYPSANTKPPRAKTNMTCKIDQSPAKDPCCDKPSTICCKEDSVPLQIKCDNFPHCSVIYDVTKHKQWCSVPVKGEPQVAGQKACVQYMKKKQEYEGLTVTVMPNLDKTITSPRFDVALPDTKEAEKDFVSGTKGLLRSICKAFCPKKKGEGKSEATGTTRQDAICEGIPPKAGCTLLPECGSDEDRDALKAKSLKQWPFLEQRHDERPNLLKGCQTMHDKQAYMANKRKCKPNPIDPPSDDPTESRRTPDIKNSKWRKC